jgi:YidC/Oxa1 family membrane protein insertase
LFEAFGNGMTALINWMYGFTVGIGLPNYGLAIILVTVLIKVALHPLTRIQMRSMAQMSQLQPEIKRIQDAYGKDKQKMQQKMMELYKERKVNPMMGCLLLLVQLPILIALYKALWNFDYVNEAHAGFLWMETLSLRDPLFILPVLAAVTTYFQAKLSMALSSGSGNQMQESMQKMMLTVMPLFIGWISATLPAGLSVYWVTFNVVGSVQQIFINRQLLSDKIVQQKQIGDEGKADGKIVGKKVIEKTGEKKAAGKSALAKNPVKKSSAKGRRGKPGKEEVAQGEGARKKRKKRGDGG